MITGSEILSYWHSFPATDPEKFAEGMGYKFLTEGIPEEYWCSEPNTPGIPRPIGIDYRGKIVNGDIKRYQQCITNLYLSDILPYLEARPHPVIIEIGSGFGGLSHQISNMIPRATIILVDFPEMLLVAGSYLIANNPDKEILVYQGGPFPGWEELQRCRFVLWPNYLLDALYNTLEIKALLAINMQSFQEMNHLQVAKYAELIRARSDYIYSDNMDCHPFNAGLYPETVASLLAKFVTLFPDPKFYDTIKGSRAPSWFYKCFIGSALPSFISPNARLRFMDGDDKYILSKDNKGKLNVQIKKDWRRSKVAKGLSLLRSLVK